MSNNKNVPQIRFIGFTDAWEQRKFQELIDNNTVIGHLDGNHGALYPRTEEFVDDINEVPYITANDFAKGKLELDNCRHLPLERAMQFKKGITKNGDVLFAHNATVGPTTVLKTDREFCILSTTATYFRCNLNKINNKFLCGYIKSDEFVKQYKQVMKQSTRDQVPILTQRKFEIFYPSIDEQIKIGEYFDNLDRLITLHQRKCENLQKIKKSMIQKMFPKSGYNVPEIRFAGFTDAWEQRKLSDIANRFDNLRVPVAANLRVSGTTPYYGANGIQDYVEGFTHEGEFVLVAEDGANDLVNYPVNYVNGRIWVNNHAHVLQGKANECNNRFLSYAIGKAGIASVLVGGGRAKLNADIMMNIALNLPSLEEQKRIGQYFSELDNLITLHQRKLETLKELKKSMLQKMFV